MDSWGVQIAPELAQHTHTAATANAQAAINDPGHYHNIDEAQLEHKHDIPDHTHKYTDPLDGDYQGLDYDNDGTAVEYPHTNDGTTATQTPADHNTLNVTPGNASHWSSFVDSATDPLVESKATGITDTGHNHTVTVNNTGDSGNNPTPILNPYLAINFIIKF